MVANTMLLVAILSIIFLLPFSSHAQVQDFCVADLTRSETPSGYPCRTKVTADDFYYRGLATPGKFIKPFGVAITKAFVKKFPAVNGLGISAARVDFDVHGVVPLNSVAATEILFVIEGSVTVVFISSSSNIVYTKTLFKGDIFVIPANLLRSIYNVGKTRAITLSVLNRSNPGMTFIDYALFANNLPSTVVQNVTFLDNAQVKKLKAVFGIRTAMQFHRPLGLVV